MRKPVSILSGLILAGASLAVGAQSEPGADYQHRANQLIGADVVNKDDQSVGSIDDLLMDEEGQVSHVVLSVGGFLGAGDELVAVSFEDLEISGDEEEPDIRYDVTEEQLEDEPEFEYKSERGDEGGQDQQSSRPEGADRPDPSEQGNQ